MKKMGWSYEQLLATPYSRYLDISRIISLEEKEKKKKQKRQQRRQNRHT